MRKNPLVNGQYYHIFSRSIAKYQIFNEDDDFLRMIDLLDFYRFSELPCKYSKFTLLQPLQQKSILNNLNESAEQIVSVTAHSIMPTHIHLILKQLSDKGISEYMRKVLDSYARFFNLLHGRKGPLCESRFNSVLVETDEQMLHLTRYLHLNSTSAGITKRPEDWPFSSYNEYLGKKIGFCQFRDIIEIMPKDYKKFVNDRVDYQKKLSMIKHLLLDDYAG